MTICSSRSGSSPFSASASAAIPPRSCSAERACGADELDRHVEHALEPLLDELLHVAVELEREPALDREPAEADRRAAEPVRVAGAARLVPELEGDREVVDLVRGGEQAPGLGGRQRRVGAVGR